MAPSTGGGHTPVELPRGILWAGDPQTTGSVQGRGWSQYPRALREAPLSLRPLSGDTRTGDSPQGQPGPPRPGASLGQAGVAVWGVPGRGLPVGPAARARWKEPPRLRCSGARTAAAGGGSARNPGQTRGRWGSGRPPPPLALPGLRCSSAPPASRHPSPLSPRPPLPGQR